MEGEGQVGEERVIESGMAAAHLLLGSLFSIRDVGYGQKNRSAGALLPRWRLPSKAQTQRQQSPNPTSECTARLTLEPQSGPHWPHGRGGQAFGPHALVFAFRGQLSFPSSEAGGSWDGGWGGLLSVSLRAGLEFCSHRIHRRTLRATPTVAGASASLLELGRAVSAMTLKRKQLSEDLSGDFLRPCQREAASVRAGGQGSEATHPASVLFPAPSTLFARLHLPAQAHPLLSLTAPATPAGGYAFRGASAPSWLRSAFRPMETEPNTGVVGPAACGFLSRPGLARVDSGPVPRHLVWPRDTGPPCSTCSHTAPCAQALKSVAQL